MSDAMTTLQYAKSLQDPRSRLFIEGLLKESPSILDLLPFMTVDDLYVRGQMIESLPTISWRAVNAAPPAAVHGNYKDFTYQLSEMIGVAEVDIRHVELRAPQIRDPRAAEMNMKRISMMYEFNDTFINGDASQDPAKWDGIDRWCSEHLEGTQDVAAGTADISEDATAANVNLAFRKIDELLYKIDGHWHAPNVALLMNDDTFRALHAALRERGWLQTTKDSFDRDIPTYRGARILDMGFKADQTTKIIPTTNGKSTIYAVRFGPEHVMGFQRAPIQVSPWNLLDDQVTYRAVIRWVQTIGVGHRRAIGRLTDLTVV